MTVMVPAVLLAAGCGKRMGEAGKLRPKTLSMVGGKTIADTIFDGLLSAGFRECVVVTGHQSKQLADYLGRYSGRISLTFIVNPIYETTNNIYSLWLAREHLKKGFYLFEADVCFDPKILLALKSLSAENGMVVDVFTHEMNGTCVSVLPDGTVERMHLTTKKDTGFDYSDKFKTVNIYKCGQSYAAQQFLPHLNDAISAGNVNSYYELVIKKDIDEGAKFFALKTAGLKWWEIDTPEDAVIAEKMFRL